jgi:hypothetical protein
MPWKKGESGNPGGKRKQDYRIKDLAQEYTPEVLKRLATIMRQSKDLRAAVAACGALLDRAYGKPAQSLDLTNSDRTLVEMFASAVRSANGLTTEAGEDPDGSSARH